MKSKKKITSSNDLYYQTYDKKAFESQIPRADSDRNIPRCSLESKASDPLPFITNSKENVNSNFALVNNENRGGSEFINYNNLDNLNLKEKENNQNQMDVVSSQTSAGEAKNPVACISNKSANPNLNLNINNFNSNLNLDKNFKNNSPLKQNMVKVQISQSPIEALNLGNPAVYIDENQMDIDISNESNPLGNQGTQPENEFSSSNFNYGDFNNFNSNTNNVNSNCSNFPPRAQNSSGINPGNNPVNANYTINSSSYISNKENLGKINCSAEGKFNNNANANTNNFKSNNNNINNNINYFNSKNSQHNYNNYKKKSSTTGAAAYSKPVPLNSSNNINHPTLRQNIAVIPSNSIQTNQTSQNNSNNNPNQIQSNKQNSDYYAKFIPILQKYEKSIPLDYIPEIWRSLKSSENCSACMPRYDSLLNQTDINFDMRAILVDWIIDVHKNYRLLPETLFICISIIDRYLTKKQILRTRLQLLGTTALFISSKYEEIIYPCIDEFTKVTDDAYKKEEVLQMETEIFQLLEFDLTHPSPYRFFEIISLNYNFSEVEFFYGCYLLEYFLISPNSNKYFPSVIALAVVLLILKMKNYENYRDLYSLTDSLETQRLVKQCAKEMYEFPTTCKSFNLFSVFNKYSSPLFHNVAQNGLDRHQEPSALDRCQNALNANFTSDC